MSNGSELAASSAGLSIAVAVVILVVICLSMVLVARSLRRQGYSTIGGDTIVRCSKGHLFTTKWIPGGSFRAVRLGAKKRYQRCPVCEKWAIIVPVKDEDLTDTDRQEAAQHRTGKLP